MRKRIKRMTVIILLAAIVLPAGTSAASGEWLAFSGEPAPEEIISPVQEYTGTVRITFLGDCTLGGEEKTRNAGRGFNRTVERNGFEYPFRGLAELTASDDLTVANLEGVLSDRDLPKVEKTYNFKGATAYTEILKAGSVECVTLANNHSHDYDTAGYLDTKAALDAAGVAYFGTDCTAVWRNEEGLMIGFLGVSGSLSGNRARAYEKKAAFLRSAGCAAVITVMHAGTEYASEPDSYQKQIVKRAAECGSDLVIGHHPHVVQGIDFIENIPVIYSLGNLCFGGTINLSGYDAMIVRASIFFESGKPETKTELIPIKTSSRYSENINDFRPIPAEDIEKEIIRMKVQADTGFLLP